MKYNYNIIVIGGGSAGLVVASSGATLGAKVALVEKNKMGGDCLNTGCVPSKSFLKTAHLAKDIRNSASFGLDAVLGDVDMNKVMNRVHSIIADIAPHDSKERFESLGVDVFMEKGELVDPNTVKIGDKTITGEHIVISTGSSAAVPPIPGLNTVPYLTNENIFKISELPKHLIILGGGPIGLELGQGFIHLGSKVTVIDMLPVLFPKDDPEVGPMMIDIFKEEGMSFHLSTKILEVKKDGDNIVVSIEKDGNRSKVKGDALLVSLGRKPNTKGLSLEKAGIKVNQRGYIEVNNHLRTSAKNIYACGDIAGPYQFTHMAGYQAGIVIRKIIFKLPAGVNYNAVPWTTYTKPEVAHVGYTEPAARDANVFEECIFIDLKNIDRAKAEGDTKGFLKLCLDKNKKVIGATFVGEKAGELIALANLAINKKMKASEFAGIIFSYPTQSEIYKFAAYELMKESFTDWKKNLIKTVFIKQ